MLRDIVSDFVKEAPPYNFGLGDPEIPLRKGVEKIIYLNKNENPFGPSEKSIEAMKAEVSSSNRYPDIRATELADKLALKHGVKRENIMVTQGATSALGFIGEVFVRKGVEVIVTPPTYPNYYNIVKKMGGDIVEAPLDSETYAPDFGKIKAAITERTRLIFLCNPNNPTGTVADDEKLIRFIHELPKDIVIVVDEAYLDFIDDESYKSTIGEVSDDLNLIVVKTFAKLYGMAGSRIGYIVSNKEIISYLQITSVGYCCNRVGLKGAEAALDDDAFIEYSKRMTKESRDYLTSGMKELGFKVWPSASNFIFFRPTIEKKKFTDALKSFGIMIRGDFPECRISIGTMEDDRSALEAMKTILEEEAR